MKVAASRPLHGRHHMSVHASHRVWGRYLLAALGALAVPGPAAEAQAIYLVRDVLPGSAGSSPALMTDVGGTLFFVPGTGFMPNYLWKTDGTTAGTALVKPVTIPSFFSEGDRLADVGGTLFFSGNDGQSGQELWKSDGTEAGTVRVKDINPGAAGSDPRRLTAVGNLVYFHAETAAGGRELWRSDGTEAGTFQVRDVVPGTVGSMSTVAEIVPVNGLVYFNASSRLWRSDGTEAGTFEVRTDGVPVGVERLTRVADALFFKGADGPHGSELWKSDGTAAGTQMVKDLTPGPESSSPGNLAALGAALVFSPVFSTGHSANEVWKSDGTDAGTVLVKTVSPDSFPWFSRFTPFAGRLYFKAQDGTSGSEVWTTDGTADGTFPLDLVAGPNGSGASGLTVHDGRLFFIAAAPGSGNDLFLWRSDGTLQGSARVHHGPVGGLVRMASSGARLYLKLDASEAGPSRGHCCPWPSVPIRRCRKATRDPRRSRSP
jgi:ELWxxDGT repeat protein